MNNYVSSHIKPQDAIHSGYYRKVLSAIEIQDAEKARILALEWGDLVSDRLGIPRSNNWKIFKKTVIAKWFGKPENRRFLAGWSVKEVLEYAFFLNTSVRFSVFPKDIACHAQSYALEKSRKDIWFDILSTVDNIDEIQMFSLIDYEYLAACRRKGMEGFWATAGHDRIEDLQSLPQTHT